MEAAEWTWYGFSALSTQGQTLFSRLSLREINRSTVPFASCHYLLEDGIPYGTVDMETEVTTFLLHWS